MQHASDCAMHNAPYAEARPCDCGIRKHLLDVIAHDDQVSVWAEEMMCNPNLGDLLPAPETYDDGVHLAEAFKAAVRELTEKVVDRVISSQLKLST